MSALRTFVVVVFSFLTFFFASLCFSEQLDQPEAQIEDIEDNIEAEAEDKKIPAKKSPQKMPTRAAKPPPSAGNSDDEELWVPQYSVHEYLAKSHQRLFFVIELPGNFTGKKGTFKVTVDKSGYTLKVMRAMEEIIVDPHHIHSLLNMKYGRTFAADSAKVHNWKDVGKEKKGKWSTFTYDLPFQCDRKPAGDLENPGVMFHKIERKVSKSDKVVVPVLIIELRSLHQIETSDSEDELEELTFKSPDKVKGATGKTADDAKLIELLLERGINLSILGGTNKRGGKPASVTSSSTPTKKKRPSRLDVPSPMDMDDNADDADDYDDDDSSDDDDGGDDGGDDGVHTKATNK